MKKIVILAIVLLSSTSFAGITAEQLSKVELDTGFTRVTYTLYSDTRFNDAGDDTYLELLTYCDSLATQHTTSSLDQITYSSNLDILFLAPTRSRAFCNLQWK